MLFEDKAVFGIEAKTGEILWQRSALDPIKDIAVIPRKEGATIALILQSKQNLRVVE